MGRRLWAVSVVMGLIVAVVVAQTGRGGIVHNATSGSVGEDSVAIAFCMLDSVGNPTMADSLVIAVSGPSGELVFTDSMSTGDARVVTSTVSGCPAYTFADLTANLGGESTGCYEVLVIAKSSSLGLQTVNRSSFQVVGRRFAEVLDEIDDSVWVRGGAVDSNRTEEGAGDSAQIAGWVWNTPQSGHTVAGTFGDYLDADISGLGMGGGAYSVGVVVYDSGAMQPVPGVKVAVRSISQSSLIATGAAGSEGEAVFNLDAGDYLVVATSPGYQFAPFDTLSVTGGLVDTVYGYHFDPGEPALPGLCRVYGYVYAIDGTPIEGARVEARLPDGVNGASILIVAPFAVEASSNVDGYFFVDLIPSQNLYPRATDYEIAISANGRTLYRQQVTVPSQGSLHLTP